MRTIRQATDGDCKLIEAILLQKIDELAKKNLVQWEKKEVHWDVLSKDYNIDNFYLVFDEATPIGLFCVVDYDPTYWLEDKPKEALYIHKVTVLDIASGSGASTMILDYFKMLGRKAKVPCVKLDVREYKPKLRAYYERNGFILDHIVDLGKGYLTALYRFDL